jgi:hypothetical protein
MWTLPAAPAHFADAAFTRWCVLTISKHQGEP